MKRGFAPLCFKMKPLIAIVGPTATGKSSLAVKLAMGLNGEIVGADSRQVYHGMAIGTAQPDTEELAAAPHHLIDIIRPDEDFSLAQYRDMAYRTIDDILDRGKLPLLVGGSGLYVWTVIEGWEIPEVAPDPDLRNHLEERAGKGEAEALYRELVEADPAAAEKIDPRNIRRVIRALEVTRSTGRPFSEMQRRSAPGYDTLIIGLTAEREELYRRTDARVDKMVESGLVEEVKKLLADGYSPELPAMSGIGYKQIVMYLRGEISLEEAVRQMKTETHRLVRRQYNWFRLRDERIHWFGIGQDVVQEIKELAAGFVTGRPPTQ